MEQTSYRQHMLRHCLKMAKLDPEYAEWAAARYERNEPWDLSGLEQKVKDTIKEWRQKVAERSPSPSPCAPSAPSTPESTGLSEPGA